MLARRAASPPPCGDARRIWDSAVAGPLAMRCGRRRLYPLPRSRNVPTAQEPPRPWARHGPFRRRAIASLWGFKRRRMLRPSAPPPPSRMATPEGGKPVTMRHRRLQNTLGVSMISSRRQRIPTDLPPPPTTHTHTSSRHRRWGVGGRWHQCQLELPTQPRLAPLPDLAAALPEQSHNVHTLV